MAPTREHAGDRARLASAGDGGGQVAWTDDARLLARLADGERGALTEIYDRHGGAALALAAQTCNAHAAADVVDQACLALWRQARAGHGTGPSRTRLLRLTRQHALNRLHDDHHHLAGHIGPATAATSWVSLIELSDPDAHATLRRVPPAERQCVTLAYLDGLSIGQIATLTGLPCATVSDHLRRGVDHARHHLSTPDPPDAA